jgi:hypothetical protein
MTKLADLEAFIDECIRKDTEANGGKRLTYFARERSTLGTVG